MIVKRIFDIFVSAIGLLFLIPLFIIISLLIKLDSKGPIFFLQKRIGKNGRIFFIIKFRTMVDNAENLGSGLMTDAADPRITRVGKILRKTSIDELPQFINIIKGDMSLVGPRPAPIVLLDRMTEYEKKRLNVRPGVTGWAQINGRTNLTWKERFVKDVWYIENFSFWLDIKIIFNTIVNVISSKDVYTDRFSEEVKKMNNNE